MDKFLDTYNQKLKQNEINNLKRSRTRDEIEAAIMFQEKEVQTDSDRILLPVSETNTNANQMIPLREGREASKSFLRN